MAISFKDLSIGGMKVVWTDGLHKAVINVRLVEASTGTKQVEFKAVDVESGASMTSRVSYAKRVSGGYEFMDITSGILTDRFRAFITDIPEENRVSSENQIKQFVKAIKAASDEERTIHCHTQRVRRQNGNYETTITKWQSLSASAEAEKIAEKYTGKENQENYDYT